MNLIAFALLLVKAILLDQFFKELNMRLATYEIYSFDELNDEAKENARAWARDFPLDWCDESIQSIKAFCKEFGVKLLAYEIDAWTYFYRTDVAGHHFRGLKLRNIPKEKELTGYCLDFDIWYTFYDEFKTSGCALRAFDKAIDAGFQGWRADLKFQMTDEYIDDFIIGNDYEFYANGESV